jgi:capsular polysaccharide biosynthesis protein
MSTQQPRKRWLGSVENDTNRMGIRGWRKTARYRDAWKMDSEGGQGPDRAVESEKKNVQPLFTYLTYMCSQQDASFHNTPFKIELVITIGVSDRHDEQARTE